MDALHTADHHPRVLLVEDDFMISDMVAEALAESGFEVSAVSNANDALSRLNSDATFDVLFTDIDLRSDIDGAALAQLARKLRPELPVVYASGSIASIAELNAVPGSTFVPKPYDPFKVCRLLADVSAH